MKFIQGDQVVVSTRHWRADLHGKRGRVFSTATCATTGQPTHWIVFAPGSGAWVLASELEAQK